jgi:uncharacterized protein (TIGR02118 family)
MIVVSVLYPAQPGESFDHAYYNETHIPLVKRLWGGLGLRDVQVLRGIDGPDGAKPTWLAIALLSFGSVQEFAAAGAQHGKEIFADIANFTRIAPVVQFNEVVGPT